jgi:hypothetical protein
MKTFKFKVGDKVRFTDKCNKGWFFGPHTPYLTGTIKAFTAASGYTYKIKPDNSADGWVGYCDDEHIELIKEVVPEETGTFIISLVEDGEYKPASIPKTYMTAAQARRVARKMAETRNARFAVFKLTGYADPVVPKTVESTFTDV